jgi:MoxR-like ATPase
LPVVERRASQMTEGDLLGLPDTATRSINGRKATTWNAPDWLVTACEQPVLLFLDEVDRALKKSVKVF